MNIATITFIILLIAILNSNEKGKFIALIIYPCIVYTIADTLQSIQAFPGPLDNNQGLNMITGSLDHYYTSILSN